MNAVVEERHVTEQPTLAELRARRTKLIAERTRKEGEVIRNDADIEGHKAVKLSLADVYERGIELHARIAAGEKVDPKEIAADEAARKAADEKVSRAGLAILGAQKFRERAVAQIGELTAQIERLDSQEQEVRAARLEEAGEAVLADVIREYEARTHGKVVDLYAMAVAIATVASEFGLPAPAVQHSNFGLFKLQGSMRFPACFGRNQKCDFVDFDVRAQVAERAGQIAQKLRGELK